LKKSQKKLDPRTVKKTDQNLSTNFIIDKRLILDDDSRLLLIKQGHGTEIGPIFVKRQRVLDAFLTSLNHWALHKLTRFESEFHDNDGLLLLK
jgi:hypothetical protein